MKAVKLLKVLYKMNLLSLSHIGHLAASIYKHGINIMMLLDFAGKAYGGQKALADDDEIMSYKELADQSEKLAFVLKERYRLKKGQKAAFLCKNHASLVKAVFAVSRLGLDVYLLNSEMSRMQFNRLVERHNFDFLVYDEDLAPTVERSSYANGKMMSSHANIDTAGMKQNRKLRRTSMSKIILLTGGTTGESKKVAHQPSVFNYLNPFVALFTRLKLLQCRTAYIATPIYHGYGIAVLLSFIALGKKVVISRQFDAEKTCELIRHHQVEAVTAVPLMIQKMMDTDVEKLKSLNCIASGGAELNPDLIDRVFHDLGDVLYNLYGTSEAGLNIIATPEDLRYSTKTLGQAIDGVQLRVLNRHHKELPNGETGKFCIKNEWSMKNTGRPWIETGDLGYRDDNGYYFFCGRTDDMIVSGGENVYPIELERALSHHPQVENAVVIGIADETFGQRLKAFVQPAENTELKEEALFEWLGLNVARFQMPKEITFIDHVPYTSLGKPDKKQLL